MGSYRVSSSSSYDFLPEILLGDVVLVVVVFVVVVVAVVVFLVVLIVVSIVTAVADEVPSYPSGGTDVKIIDVAEN